ncbi:MAG: hypothetical protein ACK55G_06590 [Dolichospermum sp.]
MTREQGGTGKRLRRERQPNGFGQLFVTDVGFFPFTYLSNR